jgi:hypothetical protein
MDDEGKVALIDMNEEGAFDVEPGYLEAMRMDIAAMRTAICNPFSECTILHAPIIESVE